MGGIVHAALARLRRKAEPADQARRFAVQQPLFALAVFPGQKQVIEPLAVPEQAQAFDAERLHRQHARRNQGARPGVEAKQARVLGGRVEHHCNAWTKIELLGAHGERHARLARAVQQGKRLLVELEGDLLLRLRARQQGQCGRENKEGLHRIDHIRKCWL